VLICAPLLAADRAVLMEQAEALGGLHPDCVEWRADFFSALEPKDVPALLEAVAAAAGVPVLFTNRLLGEGGHVPQQEDRRVAVLAAAAGSGVPALVDVEMATAPVLAQRVVDAARRARVAVVRSWHDFSSTPAAAVLLDTLRAMQDAGADVAKIAVTPRTPEDVLVLLSAGLEARRTFLEVPSILMAMGKLGAVSRLAGQFGSDLTFAAGLHASAPGQMDLMLMRRGLQALGLADGSSAGGEAS